MTTEESNLKARLFALYYGQKVLHSPTLKNAVVAGYKLDMEGDSSYLLLKPLSSISGEDAIEAYRILEGITVDNTPEIMSNLRKGIHYFLTHINCIDYLRSKSYALPFMGMSVEEMAAKGWIKLKTE